MRSRWGRVACVVLIPAIAGSVSAAAAKKSSPIPKPAVKTSAPAPILNGESIQLRVGSGNVLTFSSRVQRVAVGDERVVALHVVDAKQVLLQGLVAGRSNAFVWLADGRRIRYDLVVLPRIEALEEALRDLDRSITVEPSGDGSVLVLNGKVKDGKTARNARVLAETMLGASGKDSAGRVVSLLQFPGSSDADLRLTSALAAVDSRIQLRRMQVGTREDSAADAVVLEGRVKDIPSLVRAITLAELQLGGVGGKIVPIDGEAMRVNRNTNFSGSGSGSLQGADPPPSGLAAFVARGLVLKSASGRVLSFLEVDELPQIMVSIRVLQIDRGRARSLGIDYRIDAEKWSIGSFNQPGRTSIVRPPADTPSISGLTGGNIVASFVDKTLAIVAAIDMLQQRDVARAVAEPNITTLSGESASVLIGGEVPIPTTTVGQVAAVQGFLFQSFGVRLDIRPTLAPSGLVAMEISPSIIRPSADLSVSGVPGFAVQSVQTTARVAPGQSLVIGGLISFEEEQKKRGVPGLSEIPVMKHLFSWEGRSLKEQEILFLITPRVLSEGPEDAADAIAWRDVEALPPGTAVELPQLDALERKPATPGTAGAQGMPPSFAAPAKPRPVSENTAPAPDVHRAKPLASATIDGSVRAMLRDDYVIEVRVTPHPGDAWTRLAKRVTGDARNWRRISNANGSGEVLLASMPVNVPFELLRPDLRQKILAALMPAGSAIESEWKRIDSQRAAASSME